MSSFAGIGRTAPMLLFSKYHALGNDYLMVEEEPWGEILTGDAIRRICHRHYGVGADGILVRQAATGEEPFRVRIWNPDGSEAEKSGNGLRIFARYLWDRRCVGDEAFAVVTAGGAVECRVLEGGRTVVVEMGMVSFDSRSIPVMGPVREVLCEMLAVDDAMLEYSAATIGNPHCVLVRPSISPDEVRRLGPLVEAQPRFPNRTNVQFVAIRDRRNIDLGIWERGAGYTLASGSSSCAAAAVVVRLGLCDSPLAVHMPGGTLSIDVDAEFRVRMTGPVAKICDGTACPEGLPAALPAAKAPTADSATPDLQGFGAQDSPSQGA